MISWFYYIISMRKYIIFETNRYAWIIPKEQWDEYIYDNEITPLRICITDITDAWIKQLYDLFINDKEQYLDIIIDELNKNDFTCYSN